MKKYKIVHLNSNEFIYCLALCIFIFRYVILFYSEIGDRFPMIVQNMCYLSVIAIMLFKALYSFKTSKLPAGKRFLFLSCFFIGCVVGIQLFELNFVATILLVLFAYDVNFKKILRVAKAELIICILLVVLLCELGIIQDVIRYKNGIARHGAGFTYIGALGTFYLQIVLADMYINQKSMKWLKLLFLYVVELLVYSQDRFLGNYILTTILFIVFIIFIKLDKDLFRAQKIWNIISVGLIPALAILSVILIELYKNHINTFLIGLNRILNGRLSVPAGVAAREGYHLFANHFETIGIVALDSGGSIETYNYIDNGFLNILFRYGIIITVIVVAIYTLFFIYIVKKKNRMGVIWLVLVLTQSIVYAFLLNIPSNLLVIFCFSSLLHGTKKYKIEGNTKNILVK